MSVFRFYIKPFDDNGILQDYIEVTEDVTYNNMGRISQKIDNDRFDVGVYKFDSISFKLRNDHGKYSSVGNLESIFRFRRAGSQLKITWDINDNPPQAGVAILGRVFTGIETTVFEGIIDDDAATLDIDSQQITIRGLSSDAIFSGVETPYGSISVGDLYSDILYTLLNQAEITKYVTVDAGNINVGLDLQIDVKSELENTTVKEAIDKILFQSNSVLWIENSTVYIANRDGGGASVKTFYGQGSNNGLEDILNISDISTGLNKTFNYWTWAGTTLKSVNTSSVTANGVRKKEISFDEITNSSKRQQVIDEQRTDFSDLKQEFDLTVPLTYENLSIGILDQVRVDYPNVYRAATADGLPIYGVAIYGTSVYPNGEFSITISPDTPFKIMGKSIDTKNQQIIFNVKEQ